MPYVCVCPVCSAKAPLESYIQDAEARRAWALISKRLADHPAVLRRVPTYISHHAPLGRAASWGKAARLLEELADLITAPTVIWERESRPCTPELWALAMDEAVQARDAGTLAIPLDGHGWLRKVAWNKAGLEEARAEAARLARARGETPLGYSPAHQPHQPAPSDPGIQELVHDLAALKTLEAHNPGQHTAEIARLQARLDALRPSAIHRESAHE